MPLIKPQEFTLEALRSDVAMQRFVNDALTLQLDALRTGLEVADTPTIRPAIARRYVVTEYDTLTLISQRLYGSPQLWRLLAEANNLSYPYSVAPGLVLEVPQP
ncbi:MAG: hypothetical protein DDT26_00813 [Dehalococcoidia bacterium]|nr:hypothetical protein [Chloroflexota bacterium]